MISVTRHSTSLTSKPLSRRAFVRRNNVKFHRKYHAKVSALPFVLSSNDAIKHVALWVSLGVMGKGFFRSLLAKYLPGSGFEPLQPDDLRAVYLPVWFIDGEVVGTIEKSGIEMPTTVQSLNSYMPGFSFDPLSTLSFSQPKLEELAVPFTPELLRQHELDISCLPYSISPVPLIEAVKSLTPSQSKLGDSMTFDSRNMEFSMFAAYPVLLPVYLMRYDWKVPTLAEKVPLTCIVQAHSNDGLTYVDIGIEEATGLVRERFGVAPGSFLYRLSHSTDNVWDAIQGIDYGFSSVGIPNMYFGPESFNKAISEWLDKKVQSQSDMASLAECGVNMDHPCIRVYAKEEVDANRKFLVTSGDLSSMRGTLKIVEKIRHKKGMVQVQVTGKRAAEPEAVFKDLEKRVPLLEKQRDELKPQWVQDWQDSRDRKNPKPP